MMPPLSAVGCQGAARRLRGSGAWLRRAVCLALVLMAALPALAAADVPDVGVFGSVAERHEGLKPFPKWREVLERYLGERSAFDPECKQTETTSCTFNRWFDFINGLRERSPGEQLKEVNTFINQHRYVTDPVNWGVRDYWASPGEFFAKNGDCEDYAIAKYMSLRALGWKPEALRIVVLQDLNLNIPHAVLVVHTGDQAWVLDNQISLVVEDRRVKHYRPIYGVNENNWWRYRAQ